MKKIYTLLKDIVPEAVELNFLSNGKAKEIVELFTDYLKDKRADPEKITEQLKQIPLAG